MVANRHKVSKRMWKKWSPEAHRAFNHYFTFFQQRDMLAGPHAMPKEAMRVIAWNAAFLMACEISSLTKHQPDLIAIKGGLDDVAIDISGNKSGKWTPRQRKGYERASRELKKAA